MLQFKKLRPENPFRPDLELLPHLLAEFESVSRELNLVVVRQKASLFVRSNEK